jgi:hypothetical protein
MASDDDATDADLLFIVIFVFVIIVLSSFVGWCCLRRRQSEGATIINAGYYKCSEEQHLVTFIIAPCDGLADYCDECNTVVKSNDTD